MDFTKLLEETIQEHLEMEQTINDLPVLDFVSKEQIAQRVWDAYKYHQFIWELENA